MSRIVKLSQKQFAYAVFGMLLGDGHLADRNKNGKRKYLVIAHGPKQASYAYHKAEFLKQHSEWVRSKQMDTKQFGGSYIVTEVRAKLNPGVLRHLNKFDRMYRAGDRKKVFSAYVARRISALGLMYWYLDDGLSFVKTTISDSGSKKTSRIFRLCTYGFDDVSKRRISECLKNRFGIESKIIKTGEYKQHALGVDGMRQFIDVISQYLSSVPKCMRYKFDMRYENDGQYSRWSTQASNAGLPSKMGEDIS